jgi:hypothetical protein
MLGTSGVDEKMRGPVPEWIEDMPAHCKFGLPLQPSKRLRS